MGQIGPRYSWNWSTLPTRHGAGGDLYPVLLLLRPYLTRFQWRVEEMDAMGPGCKSIQAAARRGTLLGVDDLLSIFSDVQQIIDGRITGTSLSTDECIEILVADNTHLDISGADASVLEYCKSLFGPPEAVVDG